MAQIIAKLFLLCLVIELAYSVKSEESEMEKSNDMLQRSKREDDISQKFKELNDHMRTIAVDLTKQIENTFNGATLTQHSSVFLILCSSVVVVYYALLRSA